MSKIKVGDKFYIIGTSGVEEVEVGKVGKKYFYLKDYRGEIDMRRPYSISTLKFEHKEYSKFSKQLWMSRSVLESRQRRDRNLSFIRRFSDYAYLSDEALETIYTTILNHVREPNPKT
jgi:hypothetical protein